MNRTILTILIALLVVSCESERIPFDEVRIVASGGDSVRVEYLKNDVNIVNDDTACTPIHVSELIAPGKVGERLQMIWFRSKQGPCGVERPAPLLCIEVDDSVTYGTMENMIRSLQEMLPTAFQFTVESHDSIERTSTAINVPPYESGETSRMIHWNLLIFHIDESNNHWWTWEEDGPVPFDPAKSDSLFNLLFLSQRESPSLSALIIIHPNALFSQFMNFFDIVAMVTSALNNDKEFMAFYFEATRNLIDTTLGFQPRIMTRPWDKKDTANLERAKESIAAIPPTSLRRRNPAGLIRFPRIMPRLRIAMPKLELPAPATEQSHRSPHFLTARIDDSSLTTADVTSPDIDSITLNANVSSIQQPIVIDDDSVASYMGILAVDELPTVVHLPRPEYPLSAIEANAEGEVWIVAVIDTNGRVWGANVALEPDPAFGLGEAARRAAMRGRWLPALQDGKPVACCVKYKVEFRLPER